MLYMNIQKCIFQEFLSFRKYFGSVIYFSAEIFLMRLSVDHPTELKTEKIFNCQLNNHRDMQVDH